MVFGVKIWRNLNEVGVISVNDGWIFNDCYSYANEGNIRELLSIAVVHQLKVILKERIHSKLLDESTFI